MEPAWHEREEDGERRPYVVWRFPAPRLSVSSAPLGGGLGMRAWALNATVESGYDRPDPSTHLAELATMAGLDGDGTGMMTAVDVRRLGHRSDEGVSAWATVGVDRPSWAAEPGESADADRAPAAGVGTINIVVDLPVRLSDAALVNAVATATEAKTQALLEAGLAGTGTPTDAVCVLCPADGEAEPYGGPRSVAGSRVARAVHAAVAAGLSTPPGRS